MFDLNKAIADWRRQLASTGTMFEADLDELESHVRDQIEALEEVGFTASDAFDSATDRLGETQLLADEFAKVNPLLVWRAALFWTTLGVFLVLALRPLQELAIHLTFAASMMAALSTPTITIATWAVAFASPLLFFVLLFRSASRRIHSLFVWGTHPGFRIVAVVGAAVLMLAALLGCDWGWLGLLEQRWSWPALHHARQSATTATYALGVAGPVVLGTFAFHHRASAMKDRAGSAPLFWLAVGLFIGCVRCELHLFVRSAAFVCAGLARLRPEQVEVLMWLVTLACPILLIAAAHGYVKHGAPPPSQLLRSPSVLFAMILAGAIGIAAVFTTAAVADKSSEMLSRDAIFAGYSAWLLASIVTSCALPIIVGSVMFRLRHAGGLAMTER